MNNSHESSTARRAVLIVISGPPGSGKTTLALAIGQEFHLPLFYKDGIKEILFDELGTGDHGWSRKLGAASMAVLFHLIEAELRAGKSVVAEGNFWPESEEPLNAMCKAHRARAMHIYCRAELAVLLQRAEQRVNSRARHSGHKDARARYVVPEQAGWGPLNLTGPLLTVDTTHVQQVDYTSLFNSIREFLEGAETTAPATG